MNTTVSAKTIIEQMNKLYPIIFDDAQTNWAKRDARNRFVQCQHMLSNHGIDYYQTSGGTWKLGIPPK